MGAVDDAGRLTDSGSAFCRARQGWAALLAFMHSGQGTDGVDSILDCALIIVYADKVPSFSLPLAFLYLLGRLRRFFVTLCGETAIDGRNSGRADDAHQCPSSFHP